MREGTRRPRSSRACLQTAGTDVPAWADKLRARLSCRISQRLCCASHHLDTQSWFFRLLTRLKTHVSFATSSVGWGHKRHLTVREWHLHRRKAIPWLFLPLRTGEYGESPFSVCCKIVIRGDYKPPLRDGCPKVLSSCSW